MRRILLVVLVLLGVAVLGDGPVAGAQDEPTTTTVADLPAGDIIPRPNSGSAPQEAGDRGGALQLALLLIVLVVLAGGVANLVRQSRRASADRDR